MSKLIVRHGLEKPMLPEEITRDQLTMVEVVGFGWNVHGQEQSISSDGAQAWRVLLLYNNERGGKAGGVREFTCDFTDRDQAHAYAWQLAARFGLQVEEY